VTISISLVLILGVAVWLMRRYAGLTFLHALVRFLFRRPHCGYRRSADNPQSMWSGFGLAGLAIGCSNVLRVRSVL
jgi:hypothetical protein